MKLVTVACLLFLLSGCLALPSLNKIYSAWFCGDDSCGWAAPPTNNQTWLTNRGDGKPTVNIITFAFIDPLTLLKGTIPAGFTKGEVNYYKNNNMYVMFSIGGASYSSNWDSALASNAVQLATNAANIAKQYGVGIEIDYEQDSSGSMNSLTTFVKTYRSIIPYDSSASPAPESLLTVDLGAGTGYLSAIAATAGGWLNSNLVNWANAMVAGDPNGDNTQYWQQHLDGASWANIPPMNAKYLVGSLYASSGANDCGSYTAPLPNAVSWMQSKGGRGIGFWAAGCPAGPNQCANNCPGIQQGSKNFLG
jgi:hypothetical protein